MIVAVTGGRDYERWDRVSWSLDYWHARLKISGLLRGAQETVHPDDRRKPRAEQRRWGVDCFAERWATLRGVPQIEVSLTDEEWRKFGGRVEMELVSRMLKKRPDRIVAFPGECGILGLLSQARGLGIKCIEVAGG